LLKHYFQLFRISNIFTVPPDILAGYFISVANNTTIGVTNYQNLLILVFSSIFLYVGGLVTNDLFDLDIDKKERPNRPLPSGGIKKSTTIFLSILFLGLGLILALFLGITSTIVSVFLVIMILAYNYKLKNGVSRPFLMGGIRGLNVIYGSTSTFGFFGYGNLHGYLSINYDILIDLSIASFAVFVHIFTLTLISARETVEEITKFEKLNLKNIYAFYIFIFFSILFIGSLFLNNKIFFLSFFIAFLILISFIFYKKLGKEMNQPQDIQFIVKNMIVLLILLDASFVAGSASIYLGIMTASLLIPCIVVGKKIGMT
jgi:4-hydroxybenzoate polyprenyltransferase